MEDAAHVGIVSDDMLPETVQRRGGDRRSARLGAFIGGVIEATRDTGTIGMSEPLADALAEFRAFNYEHIYMRPASLRQNEVVVRVLRALVDYHADRPHTIAGNLGGSDEAAIEPGGSEALRNAVTWVGGMTDRFAFAEARARLGWRTQDLPQGI
jgi:dGTPase